MHRLGGSNSKRTVAYLCPNDVHDVHDVHRERCLIAVMEQHEIQRILTFDGGFDGFPGITRLS